MWRIIILCLVVSYTFDFQAQSLVEGTKYPFENNTFLYEEQDGKINYFTLDGLPAFNQSFDRLSSFDANGYAWAHAGGELFIINVIKKELILFPNELRFLIDDELETVSFISEISNKVYFPLKRGLYLNKKGELIASSGTVVYVNNKKVIQTEFQAYLSDTDINDLDEQNKEEIRIIREHLRVKGEYVFEPGLYSDIQFTDDFNYVESYFLVQQKGKWGVVCSTGDVIIPCNYAKIEMISKENDEGYSYFFRVENKKTGIIAADGSVIIPCIYDDILYENDHNYSNEFFNGFTVVMKSNLGYILDDGTVIIPCKYKTVDAYFTSENYSYGDSMPKVDKTKLNCDYYPFTFYGIGINKDKTMDFYSPQGDYLNTLEVNDMDDFYEVSDFGYITFEKNGKFGLIGKSACLKIPPTKDYISFITRKGEMFFYCEEKLENGNYKNELLDKDLIPYFETKSEITYVFRDQLIVYENGSYGLADFNKSSRTEFSWTILPEFEWIEPISTNKWVVKKNGKTGVIDDVKNVILPIEFESIYSLGGNEYLVKDNGKYNFYDIEGTKISEQVFDSIGTYFRQYGYTTSIYTVLINDKWSIFELVTKTTLKEFQFDKMEQYGSIGYKVTNNGLQGLISVKFKEIFPIKYKSFDFDFIKGEYICVLPSGKKDKYDHEFKLISK